MTYSLATRPTQTIATQTIQPQELTSAKSDHQVLTMWLVGKKESTKKTYGYAIAQFLKWVNKSLKAINLDDVFAYQVYLEQKYSSLFTIKTKLQVIKSLLSFGHKIGFLAVNVGMLIKSQPPKENLNERILEKSEIATFLNAIDKDRDQVFFELLAGLGLRISEAINLKWCDLTNQFLTIFGKSGKTRVVIVPPGLLAKLRSLPQTHELIFPSKSGKLLTRSYIHKIIKIYAKKAGINEDVSCHWFRHSHATIALENGCNVNLLSQSLGHSSLAVTSKYLHCRPTEHSSLFVNFS